MTSHSSEGYALSIHRGLRLHGVMTLKVISRSQPLTSIIRETKQLYKERGTGNEKGKTIQWQFALAKVCQVQSRQIGNSSKALFILETKTGNGAPWHEGASEQ